MLAKATIKAQTHSLGLVLGTPSAVPLSARGGLRWKTTAVISLADPCKERAAAENARDPLAQEARFELATRYEELAEATDELGAGSAGPSTGYVKAWLHR
jgi:hypothetical protein